MKCLRLHNKPTAEVHPGHKLTGPKEEDEEELALIYQFHAIFLVCCLSNVLTASLYDLNDLWALRKFRN
jgi:hypothetical protein